MGPNIPESEGMTVHDSVEEESEANLPRAQSGWKGWIRTLFLCVVLARSSAQSEGIIEHVNYLEQLCGKFEMELSEDE